MDDVRDATTRYAPPDLAGPLPGRKRLVVCCDGTWNRPDELRNGVAAPTNVAKIALGVARGGEDGVAQRLYYQRGVGTRRLERYSGGGFGYGLSRNIRDCYRFLVENYAPGDELYLFGFSRGAYTARSLAGLVRNCGILKPEHAGHIDAAYALYRSRGDRFKPTAIESQIFRRMYAHEDETPIRFVGVWDTVGALGIPIDGIRLPFTDRLWGFHDTDLSRSVLSAYQALSIDEERGPFAPTLWTQQADAGGQVLEQVWFAGVHCDVGGGYADCGLAEIPLLWMADRARACGLAFEPGHLLVRAPDPEAERRALGERLAPDRLAALHPSRRGWYRLLPRHVRRLGPAADRGDDRDGHAAAASAIGRMHELAGYCPASLERWAAAGRPVVPVRDGSPRAGANAREPTARVRG
ncbi:MAG: hypothetical protein QOD69_3216 [Solirubrobacteraceae bacterium]|nr:hypothetical protein [Solirubrobacteraceae bacterium]